MSHRLALSPHGRLFVEEVAGSEVPFAEARASGTSGLDAAVQKGFAESSARGLLALAARRVDAPSWPVEAIFWREFTHTFLTALAHTPEALPDGPGGAAAPMAPDLGFDLTLRIPAMRGAEYVTPGIFAALWRDLNELARTESVAAGGMRAWLGRVNPALHLLGKVTFHLAENKRSPATPEK